MTNNTKISCYWLFGSFTIFIIIMSLLGYWDYKTGEHLYKNKSYAIGILIENDGPRTGLRSGSSSPIFYFNFNTVNREMKKVRSIGFQIVSWKEGIVGDQYLVMYDKTKPKNAIILLDHPIDNTSTFDKYVEELKIKPLNITPYFRMRLLFFLKDYSG